MELKEKEIIKCEITDVNYEGLGVTHIDGKVMFVSGAIKDEIVLAQIEKDKKDYYIAHTSKIIHASSEREKHLCDNYPLCGGCQMLHIKYQNGLNYKLKGFNDTLKHIGGIDYHADKIIGMDNPFRYRNKVQIPCAMHDNKLHFGYYQNKTHKVIPMDDCLLQSEEVSSIVKFLKNIFNEYHILAYNEITKQGNIRHLLIRENYKQEIMLVIVTKEDDIKDIDKILPKLIKRYPKIISVIQNINPLPNNVILGHKVKQLFGEDLIIDCLLDYRFMISHKSFFQVNRVQCEKLYSIVLDEVKEGSKIIDAYCGVGTMSILLSKKCNHVYGIEVVEDAIKNAKENAILNNATNVSFILGKVEEQIKDLLKDNPIDAIVVDPPRKGLEEVVINSILDANISKVIYVSCNPSTLARDLKLLLRKYDIEDITLVDMFSFTNGVETVTTLILKK